MSRDQESAPAIFGRKARPLRLLAVCALALPLVIGATFGLALASTAWSVQTTPNVLVGYLDSGSLLTPSR
jgi:hypothetical protein